MGFFDPVPDPECKLKRYRRLAPSAGVFVSPLQLGAMSIGNAWGMGSGGKEDAFKLLDAFFDAGGNFIDNANQYHGGLSEEWAGEWVEKRNIRDQVVIATKYSDSPYRFNLNSGVNQACHIGNNIKSLVSSVEISLKRLRTTYIDILYVHWWDYACSIEEVMNGLHNLVAQGKVLYLGASNMPAWVVSEANRYAKLTGKSPFVIYQGKWNVMSRAFERDIIPMARAHGMALAPFGVLHQGKIRTDAEEEERRQSGKQGRINFPGRTSWERSEDEKKVCKALENVAAEVGAPNIRAVALAYLMHKTAHVIPILGVRSVEQLKDNILALDVHLTPQHIQSIEGATTFDIGFPHDLVGTGETTGFSIQCTLTVDWDPVPQPALIP